MKNIWRSFKNFLIKLAIKGLAKKDFNLAKDKLEKILENLIK